MTEQAPDPWKMTPAEATTEIARLTTEFHREVRGQVQVPKLSDVTTAEQARTRLEHLEGNPKWAAERLAGDADAVAEWKELTGKIADGSDPHSTSPHNATYYPVETVGPDQMPKREYDAWFDWLRKAGLPPAAEEAIRNMDAGRPQVRLNAADAEVFERVQRRLEQDPAYGPKVLSNDQKTLELKSFLDREITLADRSDKGPAHKGLHELIDSYIERSQYWMPRGRVTVEAPR